MRPTRKLEPTMARRKILIVDDHPMTRYGLSQLIRHQPDLEVQGEMANAQEALFALKPPLPSLILTDITMPGKSGLEFIKDMRALHPSVMVLVMSMHDESVFAERVLRAGARGYIMKSEGGEKLLQAIRQVLQGGLYISALVSANILNSFFKVHPTRESSELSALTDREFEVFRMLSRALPTDEISRHLCISDKTVETHRIHIKEKLKMKSGAEVRKYAVRWGATQHMI
jgi:DNA-binding NarL/FixJ family response regulator